MKQLASFLLCALALTGTIRAQSPGSAPAPNPSLPPGGQITITPEEWQELRAARTAALQANPDLTAAHNKLLEKMRAFEDKLDAAIVKADPTIAPIIAKFEAGRPHVGAPTATPPTK